MKFEGFWKKNDKPERDEAPVNPSRRLFLKASAGLATSYAIGASANELTASGLDEPSKDDVSTKVEQSEDFEIAKKIEEVENQLELFYGIDIKHTMSDLADSPYAVNQYKFSELIPQKKLEALELLLIGFSRYPHFLISESELERVLISTPTVGRDGDIALGYVNPHSNVDAIDRRYRPELSVAYDWNRPSDAPKSFLVKTKKDASGNDIPPDMKQKFTETLHHELAHFFIDAEGSERNPRIPEAELQREWDLKFGKHNEISRKSFAQRYTPNAPVLKGFFRNYGSENSVEDRGTIAEMLFTTDPSPYQNTKDKILKAKIEKIKDYYFNVSCGLMNENYWPLTKTSSPEDMTKYFIAQAHIIVNTQYDNYPYTDRVSADTYATWQSKLKLAYRKLMDPDSDDVDPIKP